MNARSAARRAKRRIARSQGREENPLVIGFFCVLGVPGGLSLCSYLCSSGVVEHVGSKGNHKYHLTQAGKELRPVVELLGAWGHRWVRSNLNSGDLDAGLLMRDMRRSVDPSVFPEHRVVVQFEYPDAARGARDWWLVSENGEVDLCLNDRGYDIDIRSGVRLKP